VLKVRRIGGIESLSLRGTAGGTFAVSREWTDQADHPAYADLSIGSLFFDFGCLLDLAELIQTLRGSGRGGVGK
jgi:hypothetical protein